VTCQDTHAHIGSPLLPAGHVGVLLLSGSSQSAEGIHIEQAMKRQPNSIRFKCWGQAISQGTWPEWMTLLWAAARGSECTV